MPTDRDFDGADAQDGAEALDETHLTEDGEAIANFDELDDVIDLTQADGDADEDEPLDPDLIEDEDLDIIEDILESGRDDEGLDLDPEPLEALAGDDLDVDETLSDADDQPADFESSTLADDDIEILGYADES
jgi:hypothetical protein